MAHNKWTNCRKSLNPHKWNGSLICVCPSSPKIRPGPAWIWELLYASNVLGSTETWGPTCRVFARWTLMIYHESSLSFSAPSATTWSTVYGRLAHWDIVNLHPMPHGKDGHKDSSFVKYNITAFLKWYTVDIKCLHTLVKVLFFM